MLDDLNQLFHPKSIAVLGASPRKTWDWSSGNSWIAGALKLGFPGAIYPVHPKAETILGYKAYSSVLDIPGEVDLAIFAIPFTAVIKAMQQCVKKGVKYVHLFAAGFSETGLEQHADIESKLVEIAAGGGVRIIGPNCMGVYCPEGGVSWSRDFPSQSGSIGFFSQSGQLAYQVIRKGELYGLRFSKIVSFGNACDLQAHDFLSYLGRDEKTTVIGAYLEGLRDGRAFIQAAAKITLKKPLLIWKGGQTEGGSRATLSHTSAIAGSQKLWEAACAQAGIVPVNSIQEMVFMLRAFQLLPLPGGLNAAVLGGAGGGSVTMTDFAEKEGLKVPHLSEETVSKLMEFVPLQGSGLKNPLDILPSLRKRENLLRVMELLRDDPNIDALIVNIMPSRIYSDVGIVAMNRYLDDVLESRERLSKPMFVVLESTDDAQMEFVRTHSMKWLDESGLATFPDFRLAARVMRRMKTYGDYLKSKSDS